MVQLTVKFVSSYSAGLQGLDVLKGTDSWFGFRNSHIWPSHVWPLGNQTPRLRSNLHQPELAAIEGSLAVDDIAAPCPGCQLALALACPGTQEIFEDLLSHIVFLKRETLQQAWRCSVSTYKDLTCFAPAVYTGCWQGQGVGVHPQGAERSWRLP